MAISFLSINDVLNQPSNALLWALNNTSASDIGQPGDLIIPIPKLNGSGWSMLNLPSSWLPTELTAQIPRSHLLECSEFRAAVNKQHVRIISDAEAERLNNDPQARRERKRLQAQSKQVETSISRNMGDNNASANVALTDGDNFVSAAELAKGGVQDVKPGITPQFKMWCDRLKLKSDLDAMSEIRARGQMTKREVKFLANAMKAKEKTHAFLQKAINAAAAKKAQKAAA